MEIAGDLSGSPRLTRLRKVPKVLASSTSPLFFVAVVGSPFSIAPTMRQALNRTNCIGPTVSTRTGPTYSPGNQERAAAVP